MGAGKEANCYDATSYRTDVPNGASGGWGGGGVRGQGVDRTCPMPRQRQHGQEHDPSLHVWPTRLHLFSAVVVTSLPRKVTDRSPVVLSRTIQAFNTPQTQPDKYIFIYRRLKVVYGTLELLQRRHWGNFCETGWSAYGLFRAHKYHLELNCRFVTLKKGITPKYRTCFILSH